jgi:hypothetical protein
MKEIIHPEAEPDTAYPEPPKQDSVKKSTTHNKQFPGKSFFQRPQEQVFPPAEKPTIPDYFYSEKEEQERVPPLLAEYKKDEVKRMMQGLSRDIEDIPKDESKKDAA